MKYNEERGWKTTAEELCMNPFVENESIYIA